MTPPFGAEQRLRFAEFKVDRLPSGRCQASVLLTWLEGKEYRGEAAGLTSQAGELRCAAEACLQALSKAVEGQVVFELVGVKSVRVFDSTVVIVSLGAKGEGVPPRVVGSCLTEDDTARAAALAVLNATNRILGNRLFMR
ncbi:MAG: hypothetical protein ACREMH_04115 [Gemmatimonadales bacterium]